MTTRTHKHFLYKWMKEDIFGEYTLRKSYTGNLTKLLIRHIWLSFTRNRKLRRNLFRLRLNWRILSRLTKNYSILSHNSKAKTIVRINTPRKRYIKTFVKRSRRYKKQKIFKNWVSGPSSIKKKVNTIVWEEEFSDSSSRRRQLLLKKNLLNYYRNNFILNLSNYRLPVKRKRKMFSIWGKKIGRINFNNYNHMNYFNPQSEYIPPSFNRGKRLSLTPVFIDKKIFRKKLAVRRHEVKTLKNIHYLQYYNLRAPYKTLLTVSRAKNIDTAYGNLIAACELKLTSLLLRSGFFENGYVVDNLAKRAVFLVNNTPARSGHSQVRCWDYITLDKKVWWYVYSRLWSYSFRWLKQSANLRLKLRYYKRYRVRRFFKILQKLRQMYNIEFSPRENRPALRLKILFPSFSPSRWRKGLNFNKKRIKNEKKRLRVTKKNYKRKKVKTKSYPVKMVPTRKYLRLKNNFVLTALTNKNKRMTRFYTALRHYNTLYRLVQRSKYANKFNFVVPSPSNIEISYKLLSFLVYRLPRKSTDINLPSSIRLVNRLNRAQGAFYRFNRPYLRNKNRYN